jgi:thioredoxin 1
MNLSDLIESSEIPVLAVFKAPWCGPCRAMEPVIQEIADEWDGDLAVVAIDIGKDEEAVERFRVMSIPTIVLIDEHDGAELGRLRGARTREEVEAMLYEACFIDEGDEE